MPGSFLEISPLLNTHYASIELYSVTLSPLNSLIFPRKSCLSNLTVSDYSCPFRHFTSLVSDILHPGIRFLYEIVRFLVRFAPFLVLGCHLFFQVLWLVLLVGGFVVVEFGFHFHILGFPAMFRGGFFGSLGFLCLCRRRRI